MIIIIQIACLFEIVDLLRIWGDLYKLYDKNGNHEIRKGWLGVSVLFRFIWNALKSSPGWNHYYSQHHLCCLFCFSLYCSALNSLNSGATQEKKIQQLYIWLVTYVEYHRAGGSWDVSNQKCSWTANSLLSNCVDTKLWGVLCLKSCTFSPMILPTHKKLQSMLVFIPGIASLPLCLGFAEALGVSVPL